MKNDGGVKTVDRRTDDAEGMCWKFGGEALKLLGAVIDDRDVRKAVADVFP